MFYTVGQICDTPIRSNHFFSTDRRRTRLWAPISPITIISFHFCLNLVYTGLLPNTLNFKLVGFCNVLYRFEYFSVVYLYWRQDFCWWNNKIQQDNWTFSEKCSCASVLNEYFLVDFTLLNLQNVIGLKDTLKKGNVIPPSVSLWQLQASYLRCETLHSIQSPSFYLL